MAGSGPSTSGRVLDGGAAAAFTPGLPSFSLLPPRGRHSHRVFTPQRVFVCQALALPSRLHSPLLKAFHHLFKPSQEARPEAVVLEVDREHETEENSRHRTPFGALLRQATYVAINVGLRVTGIALRLAKSVVDDVKRTMRLLQVQQQVEREAEAARKIFDAEALVQFEAQRAMLKTRGKDPEFMRMLHCLDRSHMDHDVKWALVQKHTADKADFSEALQHLFQKACESKEAVETLLRPDASHSERSRFWKSEQTAALIAEEESLKKLVFAQMLQAS